jgi:Rnl2 family RNA ligase
MWTQARINDLFRTRVQVVRFNKFKTILSAIEHGGLSVNAAESKYGYTALHVAVAQSSAKWVKHLLELGADPTARNRYGVTPMHMAAWVGPETVQKCALLPVEGLTYTDIRGLTPLHYVIRRFRRVDLGTRIKVLRWMLAQPNCPINAVDLHGRTPLQFGEGVWTDPEKRLLVEASAAHKRWTALRRAWVGVVALAALAAFAPSQLVGRAAMFSTYPSISNRVDALKRAVTTVDPKDALVPPGTAWVVTPKIHGTNTSVTVIRGGGRPMVARRNAFLKPGESHYGYQEVLAPWLDRLPLLLGFFPRAKQVTVYGELYGGLWPGVTSAGAVQREVLYSPKRHFVAFDVSVDGKFLPFYDARAVLRKAAPTLPFTTVAFTTCDLDAAVAWAREHADDEAVTAADIAAAKLPPLTKPNPGEGWVVRPVMDTWTAGGDQDRPLLKIKGSKFGEGSETAGAGGAGATGAAGPVVPAPGPNPYLTTGRITSVLSKQSQEDCNVRNVQALAKAVCADIAADGGAVPTVSETCKALVNHFRNL